MVRKYNQNQMNNQTLSNNSTCLLILTKDLNCNHDLVRICGIVGN